MLLSSLGAKPAQGRTHIFLLGGFGSCSWSGDPSEMALWKPLKDTLQRAAAKQAFPQEESLWIQRSCYALSSWAVGVDELEFSAENSSERVVSRRTLPLNHYLNWTRQKLSKMAKSDHVIVIGQSLGGDLALDLVSHWSATLNQDLRQSAPSLSLVTMDPIGRRDCPPHQFLLGLLTEHAGCRSFPQKSKPALRLLRSQAQLWLHFYQNTFKALHSGPVEHADQNIHLDYSSAATLHPFGAHALTESDPRIWRQVEELL